MHRLIEAVASAQMVKKERHGTINVNGVIAFVKKYTFSGFGIMYLKIIRNVTAIFLHRAAFCTCLFCLSPVHYSCVFAPCNPCRALSCLSCTDFEVLKLQTEHLNLCSFSQTQFAVILQLSPLIPCAFLLHDVGF